MTVGDLSGRRLGGFELIDQLGEGSFAAVWRARQVRLDRDVAVKVLDPLVARDPNTARRFEREGRAAAALDHPAIVPVYEAGDDDGLYFLAMRLVDGETLADLLDREGPLPLDRTVALLRPVAEALDYAHDAGLIHRDVKPGNILLEGDRVYLSDFGIAVSAREIGRYTTGSIGTADYMAPEQARGEDLDHRADLYALACVAYHALTGAPPFRRDDLVATLVAHSNDAVPPTGDPALDAFFDRALAKDPEERFDRGADLLVGLDALSPVGLGDAPPARRRRVGVIGAAVVAVIAGAAALVIVLSGGGSDDPSTGAPSATVSDESNGADDGSGGVAGPESTAAPPPSATPTSAPASTTQPAGRATVGTTLDLTDPNPHASLDTANVLAEWVLPVMYRVTEDLDLEPSLATGPPEPIDGDPLRLRWTLRDDIEWSDGTPVTAADLVATFEYLSAADTNATNTLLYDTVAAVRAVDDTTVELDLTAPNGAARVLFSTIHPIIPASAWASHQAAGGTAADFLVDGVDFAAGPFQVAPSPNPGEIELVPNDAWTGDPAERPRLESVRIVQYSDADAVLEALELGAIDIAWASALGNNDGRQVAAIDGVDVVFGTSDTSVQLTVNEASATLADPNVRQAIALAIDRDALAATAVELRTGQPADTLDSLVFAPGQAGSSDPFTIERDVDEAARLLDEAGWVIPVGGELRMRGDETLTVDLLFRNTSENVATVFSLIDQLREVGIEVTAGQFTADEVSTRIDAGEFDLLLQRRLFNSDPIVTGQVFGTGGTVNLGGFSDAEIEAMLDAADRATDPDERLAVYDQIDQRLAELLPAIPLYALPALTAHDEELTGVSMAPNRGPLVTLGTWQFASQP